MAQRDIPEDMVMLIDTLLDWRKDRRFPISRKCIVNVSIGERTPRVQYHEEYVAFEKAR